MADLTTAQVGDRVIFESADSVYEVQNVTAPGVFETVNRSPLSSLHAAWEIALGQMGPEGSNVWVRHHSTPNSIEPYGR